MAPVKVCSKPGCPQLRPCPVPGHEPTMLTGTQRRASRGQHASGWTQQRRNQTTIRRHHGVCWICGQGDATIVDHVVELADGGTDTEPNRRPIHAACHKAKTRQAREARQQRGQQ